MNILSENQDYIIIEKESGLITHFSDNQNQEKDADIDNVKSVQTLILKKYPELKDVERGGIVHRLDQQTSGVMIIARNQNFYNYIKNEFKNHNIQKEYHCFVWGNIKYEYGRIDEQIGKSKSDFRKYVCGRFSRGVQREALTEYKLIKNFEFENDKFAFLHVFPKTGRTHQIRVHLKHIHHGIVSDSLYMSGHKEALGFKRQALHAYGITFCDISGQKHTYISKHPLDFEKALQFIQI